MKKSKYKNGLASASLKAAESRIIAKLLLENVKAKEWQKRIQYDNVLMMHNIKTAKRQANILRSRLSSMDDELWKLVVEGNHETTVQAILACTLKASPLLMDFFMLVIKPQMVLREYFLPRSRWKKFIENCYIREPQISVWSESTVKRMGNTAFKILMEAGYVQSSRKSILQPVLITAEVIKYLKEKKERQIINTMRIEQ